MSSPACPRIAFLGAGRLASAIVRGLIDKKTAAPGDLACVSSKDNKTASNLAAATGISYEPDLAKLLGPADIVVLAFKPQTLANTDPRLAELTAGKLVISLLAGKKLSTLSRYFPKARNLVRTMPNTPAAIGAGFTAWCSLQPMAATDETALTQFLNALGRHLHQPEERFDALTALGGSGPAFLFEFVAALRDGGIAAGLPEDVAAEVALETVLGSARLLARLRVPPEQLRDQVVSPGGTTAAGLRVMEEKFFRDTLRSTLIAAARRSTELSRDSL